MSVIHAIGIGITAYRSRARCMDKRLIDAQDIAVAAIDKGVYCSEDLVQIGDKLDDYCQDHSDEQLNDIRKMITDAIAKANDA